MEACHQSRRRARRHDEAASREIFSIHLDGVFASESIGESSAFAAAELRRSGIRCTMLKHLSSDALIQNIDIEHGVKAGLCREDLRGAIEQALDEQRQARHAEELDEFAELQGRRMMGTRKITT